MESKDWSASVLLALTLQPGQLCSSPFRLSAARKQPETVTLATQLPAPPGFGFCCFVLLLLRLAAYFGGFGLGVVCLLDRRTNFIQRGLDQIVCRLRAVYEDKNMEVSITLA